MQVPRIMRQVNRVITNPIMSTFAGYVPPHALVHHIGRRSGRAYRTPIVAFATEHGFVTPLPYGTDTDWCLNVLEAGHCTLERGGKRIRLGHPRVVKTAAALKFFPAPLQALLRVADLPGYLVLDREEAHPPRRGQHS